MILDDWAAVWNISDGALADLRYRTGIALNIPGGTDGRSETAVQTAIRLEASRRGCLLFRNNVGAATTDNGSFIRFGLANDSAQLNARIKSADLIGIRPVIIQPYHVGRTLGVFLSREIKAAGWKFTRTDRERAQLRWAELILSMGGDAAFVCGEGTL
jgi:hypothetical protein